MRSVVSLLLLSAAFFASIYPVHSQQCVLRRRTENCPRLVRNQPVVASCGPNACYNYCNDRFAGCCAINATRCNVECAPQQVPIVITAGCRLTDAGPIRPTVPTPRPAPRPTPRPTPRPVPPTTPRQCGIQRNTQNCPRLVANQPVVSSCGADGCYNYCNGVFTNCCALNANQCSFRCAVEGDGSVPPPIVVTAGCRLN
jgi:hypothetical protein